MKNSTEIICILDKSGSMQSIKNDIIGSFNSFIESQKNEPGEAKLTLATFSGERSYSIERKVTTIYDSINLVDVPELNELNYRCDGGTPLHDAVCATIDRVGYNLSILPEDERPDKVLVVIITDGEENASSKYISTDTKNRIQHQTDNYAWQFIFMGANQDAVTAANEIGISSGNAMYFSGSGVSAKKSFDNLDKVMSRTRSYDNATYLSNMKSSLLADEIDARDESDKK